jgi:membrane protease subunit HflC
MNARTILQIVGALVVLVILNGLVFTVGEAEQVVITQFGEPVGAPIVTPGLHFKAPLIQRANYFDKRFLEWDGNPNQVPTKDKRFIWVETYARWRISDPLKFFQRLRDERDAQSRLDDIVDGETRSAVARHDLVEVVRSTNRTPEKTEDASEDETAMLEKIQTGRRLITEEILKRASARTADLGIELMDFRLKRIKYVEGVQKDVFARMIAERNRVAQRYRSEGEGEAARIRGERQRDLQRIQSEAYKKAEELRGKADGQAADIYAEAYNRDSSFYSFVKSMETYEATADPKSMLILTTEAEFLKYLSKGP